MRTRSREAPAARTRRRNRSFRCATGKRRPKVCRPRRARDHAQAVTVEPEPEDEHHRVSVLTALPLRAPPATLAACKRCGLWRNATQAVAGVGPAPAALMLVGEQPGKQDDRDGQPFSGPAGQLLDEVLARAGLDRASLYLTHAVKHFKWESQGRRRLHRTPASREIDACHHWLEVELAEVAPRVVVTLGATALKALAGPHISLSEYLGQTIAHEGRLIVPTYHPSYALRAPDTGLRDEIVATLVAALARAAALAREPLRG